jgi:hypothetical protein
MRNVKLQGAVDGVGADQGFTPISVLYGSTRLEQRKGTVEVKTVTTAWRLSDDEILQLLEGGVLLITLLSDRWPAAMIQVKEFERV